MNTLEERLERNGYNKRLAENERDGQLVETLKRDAALSRRELPPDLQKLDEAVRNEAAALAAEYASTVKLVDARNDLEFALLEIQDAAEATADELEKTDPAEAARIRALFTLDQNRDPDDPK